MSRACRRRTCPPDIPPCRIERWWCTVAPAAACRNRCRRTGFGHSRFYRNKSWLGTCRPRRCSHQAHSRMDRCNSHRHSHHRCHHQPLQLPSCPRPRPCPPLPRCRRIHLMHTCRCSTQWVVCTRCRLERSCCQLSPPCLRPLLRRCHQHPPLHSLPCRPRPVSTCSRCSSRLLLETRRRRARPTLRKLRRSHSAPYAMNPCLTSERREQADARLVITLPTGNTITDLSLCIPGWLRVSFGFDSQAVVPVVARSNPSSAWVCPT